MWGGEALEDKSKTVEWEVLNLKDRSDVNMYSVQRKENIELFPECIYRHCRVITF